MTNDPSKCNHSLIQLTNVMLEKRLLPVSIKPVNVFGCRLCGIVREAHGSDYILEGSGAGSYSAKQYWDALLRFSEID